MGMVRGAVQKTLLRRLMPLGYALVAVVVMILGMTWGLTQVQIALAGLLNGESIFAKAQKQGVIDLQLYAATGHPALLERFKKNYAIPNYDGLARKAIESGHFNDAEVRADIDHGNTIPESVPGIIFIVDHFSWAPYVKQAVQAWHDTDLPLAQIWTIAYELERTYAQGRPSPEEIARQQARIRALNDQLTPPEYRFSEQIALGTSWAMRVLFAGVMLAAILAAVFWMLLARRILRSIHNTEDRLRWLFESAVDAIVIVQDADGTVLDANRTAGEWIGRDPDDMTGMRYMDLFEPGSLRKSGKATTGGLRDKDGRLRIVATYSSPSIWAQQPVQQVIMRDVTDGVVIQQERRIAAEAMANVAEGVIIANAERYVTSVNEAHTRITGFTIEHMQGERFDAFRCMPDGMPLSDSIWDFVAAGNNWVGEVQSWRADGWPYPERLSVSAIHDDSGAVAHYVAVVTDITHSKIDRERLEYMATHDPLTGLATRTEFQRYCQRAIQGAERRNGTVAVLFVDLDAFKVVNDSYSHAVGDRLLATVAERIRNELGEHDIAGRIGGDEFTILLGQLQTFDKAASFARLLLLRLAEPVMIDTHEVIVGASIGIACYPQDGSDPVALISNADTAMYVAKTEERNTYRFYSSLMQVDARMRMELGADLRKALADDEFHMVYQPCVDLRTGNIVALEALVRWCHPERGELPPDQFIPLAESLGLIRHIDAWVMRRVCTQLREWEQAGLPLIRVALNVSVATFGHPDFLDGVKQALQASKVSPERLVFEITESAVLRLGESTEQLMRDLHAMGIGIAIDDFGTGYSSLVYLKLSSIDYLKIDRAFVADLPRSINDAAIVHAMLAVARSLGIRTIAEGIETLEQHEFLRHAGCIEGQGYYYSRGVPAADIERMLLSPPHRMS